MFKYRVMIFDDQQAKISTLTSLLPSDAFDISTANTKDQFFKMLESSSYHVVFIDLMIRSDDNTPYKLTESDIIYISQLAPSSTRIVYTEFTEQFFELYKVLAFKNIVHEWLDYTSIISSAGSAEIAISRVFKLIGYNPMPSNKVSLLHISDLHFGKQFLYANEQIGDELSVLISNCIKSYRAKSENFIDIAPRAIVVSGDMTHTASSEQYELSSRFLTKLSSDILRVCPEVGHIPVITVPGNHDYSWNLSIHHHYHISPDRELIHADDYLEDYPDVRWSNYIDYFQRQRSGTCKTGFSPKWWNIESSQYLGFDMFALNTAYDFSFEGSRFCFSRSDVNKANEVLTSQAGFTVLVCHHPSSLWANADDSKELLTMLYDKLNVRAILCGHKHRADINVIRLNEGRRILEVQTGTLGGKDGIPGNPPHFRIIQLRREMTSSWDVMRSYDFGYSSGKFVNSNVKDYDEEKF